MLRPDSMSAASRPSEPAAAPSLKEFSATVIMGAAEPAKGSEAILKLREGMWKAVAKRTHKPRKVYLGASDDEVMLYGQSTLVLHTEARRHGRLLHAQRQGC